MSTWPSFDISDTDPSPFVQFRRWFDDAATVMPEREAIALATATAAGEPSVRMVLLRHIDDTSFGWYTNYSSRKGTQLAENPQAALLWYCAPQGRQIRIEGSVRRMPDDQSDAYFASRPRGHQLGAVASAQSSPASSRDQLADAYRDVETQWADRPVPRPDFWGGFLLSPRLMEFWQMQSNRFHDRVIYRQGESGWTRERWQP
jgi:pyridoxamine-phosphate oxidase